MATYKEATIQQSTGEIRKWTADFTDDLPGGITVASGTATHIPPSGSAATATISTTATTVTAQLGPLTVTGVHYVDIQATYSNGEKSEVRIAFVVNYPSVTARVGMAALITELRGLADAGPNAYSVAGVPYWSDAQLQQVLDRHRTEVVEEQLTYLEENNSGTSIITRYYSSHGNFEETTGGTAVFVIRNSDYDAVATASYTPDYVRGEVIFSTHTAGSAYYLTGRSYNLYAAAADVWERKAAQAAAASYTWSTDNMRIDKSGIRKEYLQQANYYRMMAGPSSMTMMRSDTDA